MGRLDNNKIKDKEIAFLNQNNTYIYICTLNVYEYFSHCGVLTSSCLWKCKT